MTYVFLSVSVSHKCTFDFFFLQYGVSVNVGQLRCHGEVMWLNQKDELLGRAWKKGQGPNVLCFGKGH